MTVIIGMQFSQAARCHGVCLYSHKYVELVQISHFDLYFHLIQYCTSIYKDCYNYVYILNDKVQFIS